MQVAGWPIREISSWSEELAWLVVHGAAPEARWWLEDLALAEQIQAAEQHLIRAEADLAAAERREHAAREALAAVQHANPVTWQRLFPVFASLTILLPAALAWRDYWMAAGLGLVLTAAATVVAHLRARAERTRHVETLARPAREVPDAEAAVAAAQAEATSCRRHHSELLARHGSLVRPSRLLRLGRVYLPVARLDTGTRCLAFDRSGLTSLTMLSLPDLGAEPEVLERVRSVVERAQACPVMLHGDDGPGVVASVHGLEREILDAVDDFVAMLQRIPMLNSQVPVLARHAPLLRLVEQGVREGPGASLPGILLRDESADVSRSLERIGEVARRMNCAGSDLTDLLRRLQGNIEGTITAYAGLRGDALGRLHGAIDEVLRTSELLHVVWYCPKCNRVPAYLFHKLGVELEQAHTAQPQSLFDALQRDPETRERIVADERLLEHLQDTWVEFREIESAIGAWQTRARSSAESPVGQGLLTSRATQARLRALFAQQQELLEQFRSGLRRAVTGNARPLLELSAQARLYRDPDTNAWSCAICGTTFDDPQVAAMGRLLKIKDQLLMPMWNHLWVEKDDFRKSELFRTNEQLQRLIEKEVSALRDVSEQYRADMRPVREHLILATTEASTKREQLDATLKSLVAVGLAPMEQTGAGAARIAAVSGGDLDEYRDHAETKETLLNKEPEAQMSRRLPATDPLNLFLAPDALFRPQPATSEGLLPSAVRSTRHE